MKFKNFEEIQCFLDNLNQHHVDLGLERMKKAITLLGLDVFPCKAIQVVGTNGKGSTVTFLSALAQSHGLKVGLYTSPHFVTPRERVHINGKMLSPDIWCENMGYVVSKIHSVTYFELLTLFALYTFILSRVDLIILEAGLGGKYDATTAIPVDLVCYTPISLDHEKFLGETVSEIALEKAQAIRTNKFVLTGPQEHDVFDILYRIAKDKKAFFYSVDQLILPYDISSLSYTFMYQDKNDKESVKKQKLGLLGKHQTLNAKLALGAWSILSQEYSWNLDTVSIRKGLIHAYIPGRFQFVKLNSRLGNLSIILDGAHNPGSLEAIALELQRLCIVPSAVIFSCFADKNIPKMVTIIEKIACDAQIIIPTIQVHDRAIDSHELATYFTSSRAIPVQRLKLALTYIIEKNIDSSIQKPVIIIGSLYLLGEFFTLYPDSLVL